MLPLTVLKIFNVKEILKEVYSDALYSKFRPSYNLNEYFCLAKIQSKIELVSFNSTSILNSIDVTNVPNIEEPDVQINLLPTGFLTFVGDWFYRKLLNIYPQPIDTSDLIFSMTMVH